VKWDELLHSFNNLILGKDKDMKATLSGDGAKLAHSEIWKRSVTFFC
jgi:hypothetical protein